MPKKSAESLRHSSVRRFDYDCAIIHVGINDILPSKDMSKLKDLPKKIMQIRTTCQPYNADKVYVSSFLSSTRNSINIGQINKVIKLLCYKKNFVFIDHQNITSNDLWADGIHLINSGKVILARDFAEKVNNFLCLNSNFQESFIK